MEDTNPKTMRDAEGLQRIYREDYERLKRGNIKRARAARRAAYRRQGLTIPPTESDSSSGSSSSGPCKDGGGKC